MPAGLLMQGNVSQETLQDAVKSYSRERRAIHILTTLVKQAEAASELG
jgi:benzoyl-CoA reductase/2-hydroxyglutaryl-CoA dehydratase subunit BcrC/BadD/HgdB